MRNHKEQEKWYKGHEYKCAECGKTFTGVPASFDPLGYSEWCDNCTEKTTGKLIELPKL